MNLFLQIFGKGSRKIKSGVVEEEKISGVLLSSFSIFIPHSLSLYLYLSIYTSLSLTISLHSLYISLFTSLSQRDKKNNGPQYLLHIGGDRGPNSICVAYSCPKSLGNIFTYRKVNFRDGTSVSSYME